MKGISEHQGQLLDCYVCPEFPVNEYGSKIKPVLEFNIMRFRCKHHPWIAGVQFPPFNKNYTSAHSPLSKPKLHVLPSILFNKVLKTRAVL